MNKENNQVSQEQEKFIFEKIRNQTAIVRTI